MESERRKVYVEVNVTHRPDGTARPNFIKFENDEKYEIDRVMPCGFHQSRRNRYPLHGTDLRQAHISVRRRKRKVVCRSKILMVGGFVT
jgi:hypothetical protein